MEQRKVGINQWDSLAHLGATAPLAPMVGTALPSLLSYQALGIKVEGSKVFVYKCSWC